MYTFTLQGEAWAEDKILTASDGASFDYFAGSIAISRDMLIVGDYRKYDFRGCAYMFVLSGDGSWDEGAGLIIRNGIASGDRFGWSVALSGDRALIGADESDEKGNDSGAAYIFHRVNGVRKEEAKLVPADGASNYWFGYDVALSGDTAIIGSPLDDDMGFNSGSVYVFGRRDDGTWE